MRNPKDEASERIHPVLRQDMFCRISEAGKQAHIADDDYKTITPSILLAGALLDEETTSNFLYAVSTPDCHTRVVDPEDEMKTRLFIEIPDTLTDEQREETYFRIVDMRQWTHWRVEKLLNHVNGATGSLGKPASLFFTARTRIKLNMSRLDSLDAYNRHISKISNDHEALFENYTKKLGIAEDRQISLDFESANLRAKFLLAKTMIHEFCHAFCKAYVSDCFDHVEPWIADNRSNEMGFALENYVLGGCPYPAVILNRSSMTDDDHAQQKVHAPFELVFAEQWDLWRSESKRELTRSPLNRDVTNVIYPLPQRHIYDLFRDEMWTRQVKRYGPSAIKFPKLHECKVT